MWAREYIETGVDYNDLPRPGMPPVDKMSRDICGVLLVAWLVSVKGTWPPGVANVHSSLRGL